MEHRPIGFALVRTAGLALAVLIAASHPLRADDSYTVTYNYGPPAVSISYGSVTNQSTAAIPFAVKDNTTNSSFTAFCVDVYHDQYSPSTYKGPAYVIASSTSLIQNAYPTTAYTDLPNRLNYLGYVFKELGNQVGSDRNVAGSIQLALWTAVDKTVSYTTSAKGLTTDTKDILQLLGASPNSNGATPTTTGFQFEKSDGTMVNVTLDAYSTSKDYSYENGKLILLHNPVNSQPGQVNQNLISWGANINTEQIMSTPEPSTFALVGLGALGFIGYGLRRHARV